MNYTQIRDTLATAVAAHMTTNFPATPVFYDNAVMPDPDTVVDPFLSVGIEWTGAEQASVEKVPMVRRSGTLSFSLLTRDGTGTKGILAIADSIELGLATKNLSGVQTTIMRPGHSSDTDGWHLQEFLIDFFAHSVT